MASTFLHTTGAPSLSSHEISQTYGGSRCLLKIDELLSLSIHSETRNNHQRFFDERVTQDKRAELPVCEQGTPDP